MRYGQVIGVATWRNHVPGAEEVKSFLDPIIGKLWTVPYEITEAESVEAMMATPHQPRERCGGVYPTETRGSIWWWVSCSL